MLRAFVLRAPPNLVEGFGVGAIREASTRSAPPTSCAGFRWSSSACCSICSRARPATCWTIVSRHDLVKALFGFDAIVGNYASPYAAGSAYVMLHHAFGEVNGKKGVWGHAIGGMGAITQAMAASRARPGVEIETDAGVREVIVERDRAVGVVLDDGRDDPREIRRRPTSIRSCSTPGWCRRTRCRRLLGPHQELAQRLRHIPHECGAVRTAVVHGAAGRRRSSHRRHHPRAEPRLHGSRLAATRASMAGAASRSSRC